MQGTPSVEAETAPPATGNLLLDSLEIQNFRAFRHLQLQRLGRVNLIVGKHNVGKTCLLEALWLYAQRGDPAAVRQLVEQYAALYTIPDDPPLSPNGAASRQELLLHRRSGETYPLSNVIQIGAMNDPESILSIGLEQWGASLQQAPINCIFVPVGAIDKEQISQWWEAVALTEQAEEVRAAVRIIDPRVVHLEMLGERERRVYVRLEGSTRLLPLRSLGGGMNRMFELALALVNAQDGFLLVDEIDSNLHYSVQPAMWRMMFQVARRLNVQVVATTHSWDCIEALQQGASEDEEDDALLISLRRKQHAPEDIVGILIDERLLTIVTHSGTEVR